MALLRWREGAIRLPRGDTLRIALLGVIGFGCYQILWPVALQSIPAGDSALLIAATPVMTALLAMATGADSPNAVKLIGAFVSFAGVALVIAAGQGLVLGASLVGDLLTLHGGRLLGRLHGLRREDPAAAFAAGDHDVGDPRRDPVHRPGRDRTALDGRLRHRRSGRHPRHPLCGDARGGPRERGHLPRRQAPRADERDGLQFLVPVLAVVMAAIFLSEPIRPIQVVGGAIILAGVALLRRGSMPGRRAVRALGEPRPVTGPDGVAPPVPPLLPGEPPLAILVDYDGTVALTDVSDTVMAEHVPGIWETEVAAYDAGRMGSRRLMELEMSLVDVPSAALLATAAAQPHDPGFVPFVRRAQAAGIPIEIVSDGFGFFIEPALEALGVGELPVVTARTTFAGRRAAIAFPNGHPSCFVCGTCKRNRVLAHQAAGPGGRLHRRRGERPVRRRLQRRRVGQAVARPHLHRGGLGVQPLDGVPRDRGVAG